jgi:hypothetical protein|eukprot:COSAG06_NODE_793_length_12267_cov_130.512738_6_plen_479_part_00
MVSGGCSGGAGGGSPADSLCCLIMCPCISLIFGAIFVYFAVYGAMRDGCVDSMPEDSVACASVRTTPIEGSNGIWVLPLSVPTGGSCSGAEPCPSGSYCNYDHGDSGECEQCADCMGGNCHDCGLPDGGVDDCLASCGGEEQVIIDTDRSSPPVAGTALGTCTDLTMTTDSDDEGYDAGVHVGSTATTATEAPWHSANQRTGTSKTCDDYANQMLCKLCEPFADGGYGPGGDGWDPMWGSPADLQYANGGMTAVDACCACGGGDTPLAEMALCRSFQRGCDVLEDCATERTQIAFGLIFVLAASVTGFCVFKANEKRIKRKEAQAAREAEQAEQVAAGVVAMPAGSAGVFVNPMAGAATAVAMPTAAAGATVTAVAMPTAATATATAMPVVAQPTTQAMQVAVPQGVAAGQMMLVNTPGGQMQVAVPAGLIAGQIFQVNVPSASAAAPMAVATATAAPATAVASPVAVATVTPVVSTE